MPAIKVFGYRWQLASDDGIFMGFLDSIVYFLLTVWCCFKTHEWLHSEARHLCNNPLPQDITFVSFFSAIIVQWFLAVGMICFSMRGTMSQGLKARVPFEILFRIKTMIVILLGPLWLAFAGYIFYKDDFCDPNIKQTLMIAMVFQLVVSVSQITVWWVLIYSKETLVKSSRNKKPGRHDFFLCPTVASACKWKIRSIMLLLWSFPSERMKHALISVSEIFAYVPPELDIVITDFVAGVVLLRRKYMKYYQKKELKMDSSPAIIQQDGSTANQFPTTDMPAWMNLHLTEKFFHVVHDSTSAPQWNVFRNGAFILEKAWNYIMKACPAVREDCSRRNTRSSHFNGGFPYRAFVHTSFQKKMLSVPFSVTVDADTSSVVIVVGGVISTNDMLIDAVAASISMTENDSVQNISCHIGILTASRRIKDMLDRNGVLEAAIKGRTEYHIVTTGHNLGASTAAVLALLLRPSNPTVRCFAFEPVPCLCLGSLDTTFDTIFSIVFNNAVIPYLSSSDVECMVKEIVKSAQECSLPKYKVFLCSLPETDEDLFLRKNENAFNSTFSKPGFNPEKHISKGEEPEESEGSKSSISVKQQTVTRLYIPGRILHIKDRNNRYHLQILNAKDSHPLMILPDMTIRHSLKYVEGCLEQLGQTYTLLSANL